MIKIEAKYHNSVTPVIIKLDGGEKFEVFGELTNGRYTAYLDSLYRIDDLGSLIELSFLERQAWAAKILGEVKKAGFTNEFQLY